jgi:putative chitinase
MIITEEQLKKIYPNCKSDKIKLYTAAFNKICPEFGITTAERLSCFLGQIGVESGELRYDKELPSKYNKKDPKDPKEPCGSLYEGRKNLGNNQPGDGPKFIGRGVLQLTGRANYALYSTKLGIDLVNSPELAMNPEVAVRIACQYFKDRGLIELSDKMDIDTITLKVNGKKKLHLKERTEYTNRALKILRG